MLKQFKSEFVTSVLMLVSGTVLAQIITYLLSPVISRLYTPEDMTYLSLFTRIVAFLAVIATARFELAFPLPKRDEHAFSLYRFSIQITLIVTAISFLASIGLSFVHWSDPNMLFILMMVPFGILFLALYNQGMIWAIRTKNFKNISFSKVLSATFNSVTSVGLGMISFGFKGLIIAYVFGNFASFLVYIKSFFTTRANLKSFSLKGRKYAIAKHYADFPLINLPHVLIDLSKELFIAFYLIYTFEKDVLGLYDFSYRMLKLPITLVGISISQVFFKKAADLINDGKSIFPLVRKTFLILLGFSIIPFSLLFFIGSDLFAFVFGEPWRKAGEYSEIMAIWLMVNFLVSPISQIPILLNRQRSFFILSLFGSVLFLVSLLMGDIFPSWNLSFEDILKIVSGGQFIFLTYVLFWTIWLTKKYSND